MKTASGFFKTLYDKGEFMRKHLNSINDEEAGCFCATGI